MMFPCDPCDLEIEREYRRSCTECRVGTGVVGSRLLYNGAANQVDNRSRGRELTLGGAPQDGRTPLFEAAHQGHLAVAQMLLGLGANKETADEVRGGWGGEWMRCGCEGNECTNGVLSCFLGFLLVKFLVNRALLKMDEHVGGRVPKVVLELALSTQGIFRLGLEIKSATGAGGGI